MRECIDRLKERIGSFVIEQAFEKWRQDASHLLAFMYGFRKEKWI